MGGAFNVEYITVSLQPRFAKIMKKVFFDNSLDIVKMGEDISLSRKFKYIFSINVRIRWLRCQIVSTASLHKDTRCSVVFFTLHPCL